MEFKGTKGEWGLIYPHPNKTLHDGNFEVHNGICTVAGVLCEDEFLEEAEANAKLIAAAPDLLKALQYEVSLLQDERAKNGWDQNQANQHQRIQKAIKKAIG